MRTPSTPPGFYRYHRGIPLLLGTTLLFVLAWFDADRAIASALFFSTSDGQWVGHDSFWMNEVLHNAGRDLMRLIGVLAIGAWAATARPRTGVPPRVFLATGGLEETVQRPLPRWLAEMGITAEQEAALTAEARMIGNTLDLAQALAPPLERIGGEVKCRIYEGETHLSIVPACLTAAFDLHFKPPAEPAGA